MKVPVVFIASILAVVALSCGHRTLSSSSTTRLDQTVSDVTMMTRNDSVNLTRLFCATLQRPRIVMMSHTSGGDSSLLFLVAEEITIGDSLAATSVKVSVTTDSATVGTTVTDIYEQRAERPVYQRWWFIAAVAVIIVLSWRGIGSRRL